MRTRQIFNATLAVVMAVSMAGWAWAQGKEFDLQKADVHDRMTYHRAIDAAVWAMPLMNYKFYRDALADAGVSFRNLASSSRDDR